jgi:hypothetical protein
MTPPSGEWNIISNLLNGKLIIAADTDGKVTGIIQFDEEHSFHGDGVVQTTFNISGTWNVSTNQLDFSFINDPVLTGGNIITTHYVGHFFRASDPLFQGGDRRRDQFGGC